MHYINYFRGDYMFCEKCGTQLENDAKFCEKCGAPVNASSEPVAEPVAEPAVESVSEAVAETTTESVAETTTEPVANPVAEANTATPAATDTAVAKKAIKIDKKIIAIVAAALAVIIAVVSFFCIGNAMSNPKNVVNDFFDAVAKGNYEKAYSYIELNSDSFTTKERYAKWMKEESDFKDTKVANYVINEVTSDLESLVSALGSDSSKLNTSALKYYIINYKLQSESSEDTLTVAVSKQADKNLLFFDTYKVILQNQFVDTPIQVTKGAKLFIDGEEVDKKYIVEKDDSDYSESYINRYDFYEIPSIIKGNHDVKITSDLYETVEKDAYFGNYSVSIYFSEIKKEIKDNLQATSQKLVKSIYDSAIKGQTFDQLDKALFTTDETKLSNIKSEYESILKSCKKQGYFGNYTTVLNEISFSNFSEYSFSFDSSEVQVSDYQKYHYDYKYTTDYADPNTKDTTQTSSSDYGTIRVSYVYENNKWVVSSLYIYAYSKY